MCQAHGGSAPQVRNAAARRVAQRVDPAITTLEKALRSNNEGVALRAAQDILDRNDMKGENIMRLLTPEGNPPVTLSDDQIARIRNLKPEEAALLDRILGYIETGDDEGPPIN